MQKFIAFICAVFSLIAVAYPLRVEASVEVPLQIADLIRSGSTLVALERFDLDGDGMGDVVAVVQDAATPDPADEKEGNRQLYILMGEIGGTFRVAAISTKAVYCETCGGVFGDPFAGVEVGPKTFTIHHYGGSNWRWGNDLTFNYSRIDHAWQLVKVTDTSFHTSDPETVETKVYTPKDFGKVDLTAFDPETYLPGKK